MKTRFTTHHWKRTMSSNFTGTSYCTYLLGMWNLWMRHPCLAPGPFAVEKLPGHPLLAPSYWCWISLIHPAWSKQKHFPAIIWFFLHRYIRIIKALFESSCATFFTLYIKRYLHIKYVYAWSSRKCTGTYMYTHIQIFFLNILPFNIIEFSKKFWIKYQIKKTTQCNMADLDKWTFT